MESTLIKLKVQEISSTGEAASYIESKLIEACVNLDASIFEPLIEEDQYFQDLDKYRFLQYMKDVFDDVRMKGVDKTTMIKGTCQGCQLNHPNYQFYGKKLIPEFSYIIHRENESIEDIYVCNLSSGDKIVNMKELKDYDFWRNIKLDDLM